MLCIALLLFTIIITSVKLLSTPDLPECADVKAFALDKLSGRCLVRFKRVMTSWSYSIVSGRSVFELQARAQCIMPSVVGAGCWSSRMREMDMINDSKPCEHLCFDAMAVP
jgi:hypothetical protein